MQSPAKELFRPELTSRPGGRRDGTCTPGGSQPRAAHRPEARVCRWLELIVAAEVVGGQETGFSMAKPAPHIECRDRTGQHSLPAAYRPGSAKTQTWRAVGSAVSHAPRRYPGESDQCPRQTPRQGSGATVPEGIQVVGVFERCSPNWPGGGTCGLLTPRVGRDSEDVPQIPASTHWPVPPTGTGSGTGDTERIRVPALGRNVALIRVSAPKAAFSNQQSVGAAPQPRSHQHSGMETCVSGALLKGAGGLREAGVKWE
ncbi:hypothetical protein CB1_000631001 [Camelus ferus]|nr:hypothetical protein CB1_000631001 [Camelus ferus]